ncbi:hypothetical protein ACJX0J_038997, partial [Zea mays]
MGLAKTSMQISLKDFGVYFFCFPIVIGFGGEDFCLFPILGDDSIVEDAVFIGFITWIWWWGGGILGDDSIVEDAVFIGFITWIWVGGILGDDSIVEDAVKDKEICEEEEEYVLVELDISLGAPIVLSFWYCFLYSAFCLWTVAGTIKYCILSVYLTRWKQNAFGTQ